MAKPPKVQRIHFTKESVQRIPIPASERVYVYDSKLTNLAVCVTSGGKRSFYAIRKVGRVTERFRLGTFPLMTVEQARNRTVQALSLIAEGRNPKESQRANRVAPTLETAFEKLLAKPTRTKAKRPRAEKTVKDYRQQFDAYLSAWHDRKLPSIKRPEVERLHNRLGEVNGQHTANRALALLRAIFNSAIDDGECESDPTKGVRAFEELSRERFIESDEMPKFWKALHDEPNEKARDFILLLLLTGQRKSNVLAMRWEDVNLTRGTWTLPHTKTGRHAIPLTPAVLAILKRRQKSREANCPYVLPGRHGQEHLKDVYGFWRAIVRRAGLDNLRLHDLRRSMGSWQAATGASLNVIGKTLGHTRPETTAIYSRLGMQPVLEAMQAATKAMMKAAKKQK